MDASSRPSILVITPRFPLPAIGGDKLRILNIVEYLSRDFDVDIFAFYSDSNELKELSALRRICREVHPYRLSRATKLRNTLTGWLQGLPLQVAHYYNRGAHAAVQDLIDRNQYDVVLTHLVRTLEYARSVPASQVVLEMTDAISMNYYRIGRPRTAMELVYRMERRRLVNYETAAAARAASSVVVSSTDREFLSQRGANATIDVISNGTDLQQIEDVESDRNTIVFLGNLRYAPNEDMVMRFAERILPIVTAAEPRCRFLVIGADPSSRVQRLHDGKRIVVTGTVTNPARMLAEGRVSVCPMAFGAGVQNKVLESMALGVPVVVTPAGLEGIPAEPGREILMAAEDQGIAEQVIRLLRDDDLHRSISTAGLAFIDNGYRWDQQLNRYRQLIAGIVESGRRQ